MRNYLDELEHEDRQGARSVHSIILTHGYVHGQCAVTGKVTSAAAHAARAAATHNRCTTSNMYILCLLRSTLKKNIFLNSFLKNVFLTKPFC